MINRVFLLCLLLSAPLLRAEIVAGKRHIVILQADAKDLIGAYYFGVFNHDQIPQEFQMPITLPEGVTDFHPGDGLTAEDLTLDDAGHVVLHKTFPPGLNLVGVNFQMPLPSLPASFGTEAHALTLRFKALLDMEEFSVTTLRRTHLGLSAEGFVQGIPPMLATSGEYVGVMSPGPIPKDSVIQVQVSGLPQGRGMLWLIALSLALLLALASTYFCLRTPRP